MSRRAVLTEEQRVVLLALLDLVRYWTLGLEDLRTIGNRGHSHDRLGFAVQLCALRYPRRLLRPENPILHTPLAFVAEQVEVDPQGLADYAVRGPTCYEQLDTLRELKAWTLP